MVRSGLDLSVLIAGCGAIGRRHARVLRGMGVQDIRACDPVADQREALARETPVRMFSSYEQALEGKPDTVFICTPPKLHLPMARRALEAGVHVFCEKPLSHSSDGIDALSEKVRQAQRKFAVGYCYRYHLGLTRAKKMLSDGAIGRLVSVRCLMGEHLPSIRPDYRAMFTSKYGGAFDLIHGVDLAIWYANSPVQRVACVGGTYSDIGIEAPDCAEIVVGFANRCLASIHLDFFQLARRFHVELIGTAGVIIVDFSSWERCVLSTYAAASGWTHAELQTERDDMFRAEDGAFLEAVVKDTAIDCGIEQARKSVEIVECAQRDSKLAPPSDR